ncbi:MAG: hypothetical protein OXP12_03520 [Thaumarchaeota archaeon]|nr:hypothetical protein [Nitrososphaerota archaeon]MDE0266574.1 hypothetical protein [Nitrososphaerota archaeon]
MQVFKATCQTGSVNKISVAMAGSGGAVALGLVLMALGTQAVLEDVVQGSSTISAATPPLEIEFAVGYDGDEGDGGERMGVFAVQVLDAPEGSEVSATVLDPLGAEVASVSRIAEEPGGSVEGRFGAEVEGTYSLVIRNAGQDGVLTFGAIGPLPDASSKALAFIPFYVLLAGIMGMAGLGIYWATNIRRRRSLS